ncbi:hypothetical protein COCSADRAFT_42084 [Bipolaris sorokiniana ND90Pr]|uniref:Thioesterase TesA-like domain-containing protein n=1 Tax=Cochliobolus sativus (strain ND90Pr / ATCC 201652) TaxID=665912 RepID=M2S730_COCSN|nr:uncharacterized protein COCSADRAFT_42084 [Bipolaris sorokiniana ND90Pr]EMD58175.1 hypothetical protein COCSADRAFT_42084 [Bipolaris sorokiniana ND90Pr]
MTKLLRIQRGPSGTPPLVLVHGGGGTLYEYFSLHSMNRDVWGMPYPGYGIDQKSTSSLSEMAKTYIMMLRNTISSGDIILGGWSSGGCFALEIAYALKNDHNIRVLGLVFIDSVYPEFRPDSSETETYFVNFTESSQGETRKRVQKSMDEINFKLSRWRGPDWSQSVVDEQGELQHTSDSVIPLLAILIRAIEETSPNLKTCRSGPKGWLLGWDEYNKNFFYQVISVQGNHFTLFEDKNVVQVTKALRKACWTIERQ